jgi:hypothetical protein
MLWNRSLVMIDSETKSLWSHILGQAMRGPLKGTALKPLPADMVTWEGWLQEYPETTVLNLSRTNRSYVKDFYQRPDAFVFGWLDFGVAYSASFKDMIDRPVWNLTVEEEPLLLTVDRGSTGARLFVRRVDDRVLKFTLVSDRRMSDKETGTLWNSVTGEALEGALKGKRLTQRVGIMSFARVWRMFHPENQDVGEL